MWDVTSPDNHKQVKIGEFVELTEGKLILFDKDVTIGGRLALVQLMSN